MFRKSLVSPIALAFGLALTSAAAAQTWVGGQDVAEADLAVVQSWCDTLALADLNADADAEAPQVDEADNALSAVDLTTITLEDCREAGLVE